MARLLAQDVLLLCWDDAKGTASWRCSSTLAPGVGGALVIEALLAEVIAVDGERVHVAGTAAADPLLAEVAAEVRRRRRPPTVKRLVRAMATRRRVQAVRDRSVAEGLLRRQRHRLLGLAPVTRHPVADTVAAATVRQAVTTLVTGQREPADADAREIVLAGLAKPTNAVDRLVERGQRRAARKRAEFFAEGHGVTEAVGQAISEAQAAAIAAVGAAAAAGAAGASGGGGGGG